MNDKERKAMFAKKNHPRINTSYGYGNNAKNLNNLNEPNETAKKNATMKEFLKDGRYLEGEVRKRAEKGSPHFFDRDTMRFFSSKVSELMWSVGDLKDYQKNDIYFITSEQDKGTIQHAGSVRAFTVRKIDEKGDIETVGDFQGHPTLNDARKEIKKILNK